VNGLEDSVGIHFYSGTKMGIERRGTAGTGTALITGASSGIGAELARLLAADGYGLHLVARDGRRLGELAKELSRAHGVRCTTIQADLSRPGSAEGIFRAAPDVDVLINNAGFGIYGRFAATELKTEMDVIEVNIASLTRLTKAYLPRMIERRRGRIMNVASMAALMPGPFMAVYYATKAYVLSFTEALAAEVEGTGVTVTAFCPGSTRTRFETTAGAEASSLYRGRVMDPRDAAIAGYRGMMAGKPVVFAGMVNRLLAACARATPREMLRRTATRWNKPVT
jgi:short-subunit dehydrogenase